MMMKYFLSLGACAQSPVGGKAVRPKIEPVGDGTYRVTYIPEDVGEYSVTVKYAGKEVTRSPFKVKVAPTGDASKVKVPG